jgi:hypothetical protein
MLIVEHWDDLSQSPMGDPFIVPIQSVRRIVVP